MKVFLLLADLIILNIAYIISIYIKYGGLENIFSQESKTILIFANILLVVIALSIEQYKLIRIERIEVILGKLIGLISLHLGATAFIILILNFDDLSRLRIMWFYLLFIFLAGIFRLLFLNSLKKAREKGFNNRNVLILGEEESIFELGTFFNSNLSLGYNVLGFFSNESFKSELNNLGGIDQLSMYLDKNVVHELYICMHYNEYQDIKNIISLCEDKMIRLKFVPDFRYYTGSKHISIDFYNQIPILMFRKEPLQKGRFRILKRIFDIIFSVLALLFLVPIVFPIIAIAIKINSRGPVFYSQLRSGENHAQFKCYKFRSMSVNNSPDLQASKNDARITKVGAFLRKTSLDELPQFLNVLIGNMSVAGPRPHPLYMSKEYTELVNSYMIRHLAKPGITGWAQVNGFRGETRDITAMQKRVEHDIYYIENWSFLLDLRIIWKTIFNVIKGEETAY